MADLTSTNLKMVWPFTLLISGPSGAGKTNLVSQILSDPGSMSFTPNCVVFGYSQQQRIYEEISKKSKVPVRFVEGVPSPSEVENGSLVIIDDLQGSDSKTVANWFTVYSHHKNCSVIYIVQNIFLKNPEHRTASLNAHYLILFKNPRDSGQILHFARQFAPKNPNFIVDAFKDATERAHGYIVFDFKQNTPELLRVKDSVFRGAMFYVDINEAERYDLASLQ